MFGLVFMIAAAAGAEPGAFDAFFSEFARKRDGIRTLEARFTQESVVSDETIESKGTVVYAKPRRIVFRYDDPDPSYLLDGLRAYEYAPDLKQCQSFDLEDNPQTKVFFLGFEQDATEFQKAYDVEVFDPENEPEGAKGIRLRPKTADKDEAYFEQVTLYLRAEDYLPYRIHIVNDADSQVTIKVSDFVVNGDLGDHGAQLRLPEGTAVVDQDRLLDTVGPEGAWIPEDTSPIETVTLPDTPKETPAP